MNIKGVKFFCLSPLIRLLQNHVGSNWGLQLLNQYHNSERGKSHEGPRAWNTYLITQSIFAAIIWRCDQGVNNSSLCMVRSWHQSVWRVWRWTGWAIHAHILYTNTRAPWVLPNTDSFFSAHLPCRQFAVGRTIHLQYSNVVWRVLVCPWRKGAGCRRPSVPINCTSGSFTAGCK